MSFRDFDDELVQGCQRYLDTLKKRSIEVEKKREEERKIEERKRVRREYWRKILYGGKGHGLTVIVPEDSKFK